MTQILADHYRWAAEVLQTSTFQDIIVWCVIIRLTAFGVLCFLWGEP